MANTLRFKRGLASGIPTALAGEPLFTTDTFDLYIGNGTTNTRFQKYIASGATTQILRGDGSLYTFPLAISSPTNGQVLKYNGTSWVNDSDAGITGSGTTNYLPKFTSATTLGNSFAVETGGGIDIVRAGDVAFGLTATAAGSTSIYLTPTGGGFGQLSTLGSAHLRLGTNGTERARIFATGNFGIGTGATDSGQRLQVTGTTLLSDTLRVNGNIAINAAPLADVNLYIRKNLSGSIFPSALYIDSTVTSTSTTGAGYINTVASTENTTFTLPNLYHFRATQGTFGASSTVTNQFGFIVENTLTGATNDFGFYGNLAAGTNIWNLYMNGTANNYMAGRLGIGTLSLSSMSLHVARNLTGGTVAFSIYSAGSVANDVTSTAISYYSRPSILAGTTLGTLVHYTLDQGTFSGTVTNQIAFGTSVLTGGTNNYGFYGELSAGTGRWNLYCVGTADNYLAGSLGIGTTTLTGTKTAIQFDGRTTTGLTMSTVGFDLRPPYNLVRANIPTVRLGSGSVNGVHLTFSEQTSLANGRVTGLLTEVDGSTSVNIFGGLVSILGRVGTNTAHTTGHAYGVYGLSSASNTNGFGVVAGIGSDASYSGKAGLLAYTSSSTDNIALFFNGGTEVARIAGNGNVLIGSTSDTGEKLQVSGTSVFRNDMQLSKTTASLAEFIINDGFTSSTTTEARLRVQANSTQGYIIAQGPLKSTYKIQGPGDFSIYKSGTDGNITILNDRSTGNILMAAGGSSTAHFTLNASGNLGLGVTPSAWSGVRALQVGGNAAIINNSANSSSFVHNGFYNGTNFVYLVSSQQASYLAQTNGAFQFFNAPSGTAGNAITFTQAMTLFSTNNLAIGSTTDSGERLQVTGTARITGATSIVNDTNAAAGLSILNPNTGTSAISRLNLGSANSNWFFDAVRIGGNLSIKNNISGSPVELLSITNGGNLAVDTNTLFVDATNNRVGIGTATPDATLRVAGTVNATQAIFGNVDGRGLLIATSQIAGTNDAGTILNARGASSGTFIFQTDGTQRVQIDSTGLIINGGNALEFINSAANPVSAIRPTGGGTSVMSTNSNGLHIAVGTEAAGDLILASNNTERVRLSSNGWFSHTSATNPSSSVTDSYVQYSADVTAGNAAPHFRTENGAVIKLYQETTAVGNSIISLGGGSAVLDDTTFDGYTLRQIVKALRNQGILA